MQKWIPTIEHWLLSSFFAHCKLRIESRSLEVYMFIHHLRNASLIVSLGEHRLLVDPMLSDPGAMPGFKMFGGGRRRNPLVPLPANTKATLDEVTGVVITHEHPDHFDGPALAWIKQKNLPVWGNCIDLPNLRRKGLDAREITDGIFGISVEVIRSRHGQGLVGWLMGPVAGYFLVHPDEPSLYIIGDSVLTPSVMDALQRLRPDVVVAPAGAANMGLGGDILFSMDELVQIVRASPGQVVLNHLEALDHCPTTRSQLRARMDTEGFGARVLIPKDGEKIDLTRHADAPRPRVSPAIAGKPGFQKWVTQGFAGT